ncbi:hypothetical protein [Yeosuana sp. AK3]
MEAILTLFENTLILKSPFKLSFRSSYSHYKLKRLLLNTTWGFINIFMIVFAIQNMIESHFEMLWIAPLVVYALSYWIISSMLIDALIGDEIDNQLTK